MSVRCIRCGTPIQGTAQFCDDCAALKAEEEAHFRTTPALAPGAYQTAWAQTVVQPGARACPACGQAVPAGADFCPDCGRAVGGTGAVEYGGFWIRLLAAIIDGIIIGVVQAPVGLLLDFWPAQAINVIIGFAYTVGFWLTQGATPGKMALGMKVTMVNGEPITGGAAVARYFGYLLDVLTLGIGYLMIAWTPQKRGLHDYLAGTVVVKKR
jgi:uncharacterized RDD family membrane protein YckC/predicted nucleic acid-binding Zn ribbon protein